MKFNYKELYLSRDVLYTYANSNFFLLLRLALKLR